MREIELWTADGDFVAVVDIPPFQDHSMPKVVMWGSRVFHEWRNEVGVYAECFSVYSLTPPPGRPRSEGDKVGAHELLQAVAIEKGGGARACRGCGRSLVTENYRMADGCPCNSKRGVNHGLVSKNTCTCDACDPEQTGSTRYPPFVEKHVPPVDRSARCTVGEALAPGVPDTEDRGDGQQKGYVILCDSERAKGFVRPVRRSYVHVGRRPKHILRDLTPEEREQHKSQGYAKYEAYPRSETSSVVGRYWTDADLKSGCGSKTTMGQELAETYAREPSFYSGTFCANCGKHFPVGADGEFLWDGTDERVGT